MNERIKEIARQAQTNTARHFGDRWASIGRAEFMMIYNQKIAELLVRECVGIIEGDKRIDWGDSAELINSIKDNFGVK